MGLISGILMGIFGVALMAGWKHMSGYRSTKRIAKAVDIKLLGSLSRDDLKKICGDNFPEWISFPVFEQRFYEHGGEMQVAQDAPLRPSMDIFAVGASWLATGDLCFKGTANVRCLTTRTTSWCSVRGARTGTLNWTSTLGFIFSSSFIYVSLISELCTIEIVGKKRALGSMRIGRMEL